MFFRKLTRSNYPVRLIELFSGIGGVAEAARQLHARVPTPAERHRPGEAGWPSLIPSLAVDIDADCGTVYERNFGAVTLRRSIESLDFENDPAFQQADGPVAWWLSPPCQPYCRRGRAAPQLDRRCDALLAIIRFFESSRHRLPTRIALENVPGFANSTHAERFRQTLCDRGYAIWGGELCPTQFGIPNRRRRYYLVAARDREIVPPPEIMMQRSILPSDSPTRLRFQISDILESHPSDELTFDATVAAAYRDALDVVDASDPEAVTACFAGGYGKSIVRSGSYLRQNGTLRRFSPLEVARLLGFSDDFQFPETLSTRRRWKMLGNSVSIPVVRAVLRRMID